MFPDQKFNFNFVLQLDIHLEETTTDQVGVKSLEGVTASATSEAKSERRSQSATRVAKTLGVNFTNILLQLFFGRKCFAQHFSNYSLAL